MLKWTIIGLFCCNLLLVKTSDAKTLLVDSVQISLDFVKGDDLHNLYGVKGGYLYKLSEKGDTLAQFVNQLYGNITDIDVSNVHKVLVFYQSFNLVLFLDKSLSQVIGQVDLNQYLQAIHLVCADKQGGLWLFDDNTMQLVHLINLEGTEQRGNALYTVVENTKLPEQIHLFSDHIILYQKEMGVLKFDIYGNFMSQLFIPECEKVLFTPKGYFSIQQQALFFYSYEDLKEYELFKIKPIPKSFTFSDNKLIVQTDNKLYSFQQKE